MTNDDFIEALEGESKIDIFKKCEIRKTVHAGEWWFSVKDAIEALVDTTDGTKYIGTLKNRDPGLNERYPQIVETLPFASNSGIQKTNFVNTEGLFRIMQSVPSTKIEPFKKWLAKVAFERLQEENNPELAVKRAMTLYRAKGYDNEWVEARIQNIATRKGLTEEWKKRGIEDWQYASLTDAIYVEALDSSAQNLKNLKGLKSQSLRDNMTPIEITLTTLGEQATKEIAKAKNSQGYAENFSAAKSGGKIAGSARKEIEEATGNKVVSDKNYLTEKQRKNNKLEIITEHGGVLDRVIKLPLSEDN